MCQNVNDLYFKLATGTLVATFLGIIAGIVWPSFFTNFPTLLITEVVTAAVILIVLAVFLLARQTKNNQLSLYLKYYINFLIFGAVGCFIFSVLALSTALSANLVSAIIFGVSVGFFALTVIGLIFLFKQLLSSVGQ